MKRIHLLALAILSGLLFALAWPQRGFPFLIFFAFVPLLVIENHFYERRSENHPFSIFWYLAVAFFTWNILTVWWILNSTLEGGIFALLFQAMIMSLTFQAFHISRRNIKDPYYAYMAFIAFWLTLEYIHLRWEFNFPWLNLGNVFAAWPRWIQWYEYTGIFGGSLWVLMVNLLLFLFIRGRFIQGVCSRKIGMNLAGALLLIILPALLSNYMFYTYTEKKAPVNITVVQPNLDPYSEQYSLNPLDVTGRMLNLARQKADSTTDLFVTPESALQEYAWESQLDKVGSVNMISQFLKGYPRADFVAGISTSREFLPGEPLTPTARKFRDSEGYYDAYNTALFMGRDGLLQVHHKSKLTPGVEIMPYARYIKFLEKLALNLGGTIGSLGTDSVPVVFTAPSNLEIAAAICYESVYGEYMASFVQQGAELLLVITNDGWWGDTPGHRQHLMFSPLRAIETRRSIARSANTGISCFINQRGEISQATKYWVPAVISEKLNANDKLTFYVKHGDYIGRFFVFAAILLGLFTLSKVIINRKRRINSNG